LKAARDIPVTEAQACADGASTPCIDAVEAFLDKAADIEPTLHAFTSIDANRLRREAATLDSLPASARGPLHGVLVAVKEVYDVAGYECGWGTPIHAGRIPKDDCSAVSKLRSAGALIAGITVSTEYAMSRTGPTVNPFDATRTPGASSQGSAAAVGAGLVPAALGSQTIGSVIRPAAYCGCIGIKPSWGLIDVSGSMALSEAIDHAGILAADPDIADALLAVLAPNIMPVNDTSPVPIKVLSPWYDEPHADAMMAAVARAADTLRSAGHTVAHIQLPANVAENEGHTLDTILAYGMARHHGGDFARAPDQMSDRIIDYIQRGKRISEAAYIEALNLRHHIANALNDLTGEGVLLMPAATGIAPKLEDGTGSRAPQRLWTLAGLPAMTLPFGLEENMPLGVQVIAGSGADLRALNVVRSLFNAG
jgi:Asp-tRNA(Asn)/Glu-tRNA(Gln) amidotransferase A subunit family amidase